MLDCGYGVASLTFTPNGARLIAEPGMEGALELWTPATGEHVQLPDPCEWLCRAPVVHPAGAAVLSVGRHLTHISLDDRSAKGVEHPGEHRLEGIVVSPGGKWAVAGPELITGRLFGYPLGPDGTPADTPAWVVERYAEYERPGGFVSADRFVTTDRGTLVVRDAATGEVRATVASPARYHFQRAMSADGRRFTAAAGRTGPLYVWDTTAWADPVRIPKVQPSLAALAFHPTRPLLATVQQGQTVVKFLDANTGKVASKFQWKVGSLQCVAFSPDGTLAAAGGAGGKIVVWDVDE